MYRRIPPLNAIRAFEAVARHQQLGAAADELRVTHSALSQQVKHLEEWFECELFAREKGRLVLKSDGHALLKGYTRALDLLHDTSEQVLNSNEDHHLTIQGDPAFLGKVLMTRRQAIVAASRSTTIDIITERAQRDSFPDTADIVIDMSDRPSWKNVHREHLLDIHGFPACSPALLGHIAVPKRPLDLRSFPLLHGYDRDSWNSWLVEHAGSTSAGCTNTYFDDFAMTISAAVMGEGAIMADPILCKDELLSGKLVPLFDSTVHEVSYYAFCTIPKYGNRNIRRAFDALVRDIRAIGQDAAEQAQARPRMVHSWDPSGSAHTK